MDLEENAQIMYYGCLTAFLRQIKMIVIISMTITALISCNEDDDDNGGPENKQQDEAESKGSGNYSMKGYGSKEFTAKVSFYDSTDFMNIHIGNGTEKMDHVTVIKSNSNEGKTSINAFLVKNKSNSKPGKGEYKVKFLDSTVKRGANVFMEIDGKIPFSTFVVDSNRGSISINNRTSATIEGTFNDVKLGGISSGAHDSTIILNGSFSAAAR